MNVNGPRLRTLILSQIENCSTFSKIDKNEMTLMEIMIGSPLPSSLQLKSIKKYNVGIGNISTRVKSAEETLTQITPLCKKIGVTRISDITYMDKLYLPNYTAVLPGTEDTIWVYGGKGPTKIHARAGARWNQ